MHANGFHADNDLGAVDLDQPDWSEWASTRPEVTMVTTRSAIAAGSFSTAPGSRRETSPPSGR